MSIENHQVELRGAVLAIWSCFADEVLVEGPAGCVAGETELWDPVAGEGRRIDDLCRSGTRPWVQTMGGPVRAQAPFLKGYAPLYRVTLESGETCLATSDHLFLTRRGWTPVYALSVGTELRSGSPVGAHRSSQTDAGFRCGCPTCCRCSDPPLQAESGSAPVSPPSECDARGPARADSLVGGQASTGASTHPCPASGHPSIQSSGAPLRDEPSGASQAAALAIPGAGYRDGSGKCERGAWSFQRPCQWPQGSPHPEPSAPQPHAIGNTQRRDRDVQWSQPYPHSRDLWSPVKVLRRERTDFYYDLHVPGAEHYLAGGLWSHNTGKTRGLLERSLYIAERWPGVRQLWVRQTLRSLRQSVLVTWEDEVIWPGHPCMHGKATREHRDLYRWPNRSETVLAGADTPEKFLSAQYDIIWLWEAREISPDTVQVLSSRNRNGFLPWQQMIFDTNPGPRTHHLNKRFPPGYRELPADHPSRMVRIDATEDQQVRLLSRHPDNPAFFDKDGTPTLRGQGYMRKLDRLTGARRRNLKEGVWASEEGVVWEEYDEDVHLVEASQVPDLEWFFFSFDKGTRHPGCLQVWGVDGDDRMYRVVEVYRVGMELDWWADVVVELDNEFRPAAGVSDHHPDWITKFNDVLNEHGRPRLFRNAAKDRDVGIAVVQKGLSLRNNGPRILLVRGALRYGRCPHRDEALKPACTEEEILDYVWAKHDSGQISREMPDPLCSDHGCDALRYAAMFRWKRDMRPKKAQKGYAEGTLGHTFGHDKILGPAKRSAERIMRMRRRLDKK